LCPKENTMPKPDLYHGVTVTLVDSGPRTIALPSSSIIGLVDTFTPGAGLATANQPVKITRLREGRPPLANTAPCSASSNHLRQNHGCHRGSRGGQQGAAKPSKSVPSSAVKPPRRAVPACKPCSMANQFGLHPRLLVAPGHSARQPVAAAMDSLAGKLRAIAVIDGPDSTDDAAIKYATNFGSKRLYMVDAGGIKVWDSQQNKEVLLPASAATAGLFAAKDGQQGSDNGGFWCSPSNSEFAEVLGTGRAVEYLYGDPTCRANLLNRACIATIIREGGFRLWGNRTLSADPKWSFVTRVRTCDMVMDAILAGHQWAVDRGITKTYVKDVSDGLDGFMRDLKSAGAVINFEVFPDPLLNTATQLEEGKVYWRALYRRAPS
jgi:phage tail sheath protein FI